MSEPNGDPSATPKNPAPDPAAGGAASNNLTRAPRVNPPNINQQKDAPPAGAPPGISEFLAWMKMLEGGTAPDAEAAAAGRNLIPKEQKKFSRRGNEPVKPTSAAEAGEETVAEPAGLGFASAKTPLTASTASTASSLPPSADVGNAERKRRSKDTSPAPPGLRLLGQGLVFALIVGSFFVGRATVPKDAPKVTAAPGAPVVSNNKDTSGLLTDDLLAKVDEALTAATNGNGPHALELLQSVKDSGVKLPGINYQLALLCYNVGDMSRIFPLLNQSIADGEEVANCYLMRGTIANRQGGVQKGIDDMALAAKIDPFNARNAYFLGEALRRSGKPQAALVALESALHRLREPALESIYSLKIRLTKLELGREAEFADEVISKLAMNPPPLDWVFTAAAVEMKRGNLDSAASLLDKTQSLAPENELLMRLRDFYFFSFSDRKELVRFFAPIKAVMRAATPPVSLPGASPGEPFVPGVPLRAPLLDAPNPINLLKKP